MVVFFLTLLRFGTHEKNQRRKRSEEVHGWVVSSLRIAVLSAVISMDLVHLSKYNAYLCWPPSHPAANWDVLHNLLLYVCNMTGGTKKVFLSPSEFVSFLFFFLSFFFCRVPNFLVVAPDAFGKHSSFWGTKKKSKGKERESERAVVDEWYLIVRMRSWVVTVGMSC